VTDRTMGPASWLKPSCATLSAQTPSWRPESNARVPAIRRDFSFVRYESRSPSRSLPDVAGVPFLPIVGQRHTAQIGPRRWRFAEPSGKLSGEDDGLRDDMQLPVGVVTTFTEQAEGPFTIGCRDHQYPDGHADGQVAAERRFQMLRPVLASSSCRPRSWASSLWVRSRVRSWTGSNGLRT
jgi:hypothetical protein